MAARSASSGSREIGKADRRRLYVALGGIALILALFFVLVLRATEMAWQRTLWTAGVAEPARAATAEVESALLLRMQSVAALRAPGPHRAWTG